MKTLVAAALLARWICLSAFGQEAPPLEPDDVMTVAVTSAMYVAADITDSLSPNVMAAHNASLPFYIVEDNSASCGGTEGVSDTIVSALWFIDSAFAYANRGVDKLFVSSSSSEHYSPFLFDGDPSDSGLDLITYTPEVFPFYY